MSLAIPREHSLFLVQKLGTPDYQPVKDLREVNKRVTTTHPIVPNLCTLLSLLPPEKQVFTLLDLEDAAFASHGHLYDNPFCL